MNVRHPRVRRILLAAILALGAGAGPATAQAPPATRPGTPAVAPELVGRNVEEVRFIGKGKALDSVTHSEIARNVRTREGAPFDPATVEADYQRVFRLRKFANVEARVEPTRTGVIVAFEITEQALIKEIRFLGNDAIGTKALLDAILLRPGESIDAFRLSLAQDAIRRLYLAKNFPDARAVVDAEQLRNGVVLFKVNEGGKVRIVKIEVLGNQAYADSKLEDQVKSKAYFPFFVSGTYDPDQVERDVAAIRQFYEERGFFDIRVARKLVVSPDSKEVKLQFLVDEGKRYTVEKISFRGNKSLTEAQLKEGLKLVEGMPYEQDLLKRDTRQLVKHYSPLGFIYMPSDPGADPDYLRISDQRVFKREAGKVEIVYDIHEGRPFKLGRVIVKGNARTQDKVVLREMRGVNSGELYNSDRVARSLDRIRGTNFFQTVTITPIRTDPESNDLRDLLVEVQETQTAKFIIGAGVTSNSGVMGQIQYEQRNFDISNWPDSWDEAMSNRAWTGAGQTFRISLEPGTEMTRAKVDFIEPYLFDQPFSLGLSAYLSQRLRPDWTETRLGGRVFLGHRFTEEWTGRIGLRAETVDIGEIEDPEDRAREVIELDGTHGLTSVSLEIRRNTTNSAILPSEGSVVGFTWEHVGALGGDFDFDKFTAEFNWYTAIYEDLLDRKTILATRLDIGYIAGDAPFFERFYGGGTGSMRGFRYRGVSPRSGSEEDAIGGDFSITGTAELSFPLAGDSLRGVLFVDAGTVETDFEINTIRSAVGFGFRIQLPFFGQVPLAIDFGFPITRDDQDERKTFSFSLGLAQ